MGAVKRVKAIMSAKTGHYTEAVLIDNPEDFNGGGGGGTPSNAIPKMDGVGAAGTSAAYSRGDHVHPSDISIAGSAAPKMDSAAAVGVANKWSREDHVHPSDTAKAAVVHTHTKSAITDLTDATTTASGLMSAADKVKIVTGTVTPSLTVYVAPSGNDITAAGTQTDPFATPSGALNTVRSRYPGYISYLRINIAAGEYTGTPDLAPTTTPAEVRWLEFVGGSASDPGATKMNTGIMYRQNTGDYVSFANMHISQISGNAILRCNMGTTRFSACIFDTTANPSPTYGIWSQDEGLVIFGEGNIIQGNYNSFYYMTGGRFYFNPDSAAITFRNGIMTNYLFTLGGSNAKVDLKSSPVVFDATWTMNNTTAIRALNGGQAIAASTAMMTRWLNGKTATVDTHDMSYITGVTVWRNAATEP